MSNRFIHLGEYGYINVAHVVSVVYMPEEDTTQLILTNGDLVVLNQHIQIVMDVINGRAAFSLKVAKYIRH